MSGHRPRAYFSFSLATFPFILQRNLSLGNFTSPGCLCLKGPFIVVCAEDLDTVWRSAADAQVGDRRL